MEWKSFADEKPEVGTWVVSCRYPYTQVMGVSLIQDHIPPIVGNDYKLATHWLSIPEPPKPKRKTHPAPKAGTIVTEENLYEFIEKYSFWLVLQGIGEGYYLSNYNGNFVSVFQLQRGNNLPYQVNRVEDTDEITWRQEEL